MTTTPPPSAETGNSTGQFAAASPETLLELQHVSKSYGSVQALKDVDIAVRAHEVVALVGDNGAGKSTLVKIMAGNLIPDTGSYFFGGRQVAIHSPADASALGIQTVYQDLALCDNLDAVQNLFLGREPLVWRNLPGARINRPLEEYRAREILREVRLDQLPLRRPVGAMSGGQRQNIAIARSLLWDPRIILLDEPTAALSVAASQQVAALIQRLRSQNRGVIIVSHDIHNLVMSIADRIIVLRLGRKVAEFVAGKVTGEQVVAAIVGVQEGSPREGFIEEET